MVPCAGITALVLYLKLFSYVTCLTCATEKFSIRTLYGLCVDNFSLIILYQYQPMRIFSRDFLLIFVLKKKNLIKKLPGVSVFIGVGGGDVLFSVPEVLS